MRDSRSKVASEENVALARIQRGIRRRCGIVRADKEIVESVPVDIAGTAQAAAAVITRIRAK